MTDKHKISIRFFTTAKCGEDDANSNLKQKALSSLATLIN